MSLSTAEMWPTNCLQKDSEYRMVFNFKYKPTSFGSHVVTAVYIYFIYHQYFTYLDYIDIYYIHE